MFTEDAFYLVTSRENADRDLPVGLIYCEGQGMIRDRAFALEKTAMFAPRYLRHIIGNLVVHGRRRQRRHPRAGELRRAAGAVRSAGRNAAPGRRLSRRLPPYRKRIETARATLRLRQSAGAERAVHPGLMLPQASPRHMLRRQQDTGPSLRHAGEGRYPRLCLAHEGKSWIPACAGMTEGSAGEQGIAMTPDGFGIGARAPRKEDARHLRGRGCFVSDIHMAGLQDVAFLRSPVAHARILSPHQTRRATKRVCSSATIWPA